jgi:hypothetical protein
MPMVRQGPYSQKARKSIISLLKKPLKSPEGYGKPYGKPFVHLIK